MTVFLRALWGPFAPTEGKDHKGRFIDWHFFGIREDNRMGRWALRFRAADRKFRAEGLTLKDKPPVPELVDAFVPDKPMLHGENVTEILRRRISDADMARATALALRDR